MSVGQPAPFYEMQRWWTESLENDPHLKTLQIGRFHCSQGIQDWCFFGNCPPTLFRGFLEQANAAAQILVERRIFGSEHVRTDHINRKQLHSVLMCFCYYLAACRPDLVTYRLDKTDWYEDDEFPDFDPVAILLLESDKGFDHWVSAGVPIHHDYYCVALSMDARLCSAEAIGVLLEQGLSLEVADSRSTSGDLCEPEPNVFVKGSKSAAEPDRLKEPSVDAFIAYRLYVATGMKQKELAERLVTELKRPVTQGTVSRWLNHVEEWIEAGNVLPDMPKPSRRKPVSIDSKKIEMGARLDHRAERQRHRRNTENDD
jgi:hypothetical protein